MAKEGTVKTDGFEMDYFYFGKGDRAFVTIPGLSIQSIMGAKDLVEENYQYFANDFV